MCIVLRKYCAMQVIVNSVSYSVAQVCALMSVCVCVRLCVCVITFAYELTGNDQFP